MLSPTGTVDWIVAAMLSGKRFIPIEQIEIVFKVQDANISGIFCYRPRNYLACRFRLPSLLTWLRQ